MGDRTDHGFWVRGFIPVGIALTLFQAVEHWDKILTLRFLIVALVINCVTLGLAYVLGPWLYRALGRIIGGAP